MLPTKGLVLSLCDFTGIMAAPWVRAGYTALLVDPQHAHTGQISQGVWAINQPLEDALGTLRGVMRQHHVVGVFGFPVCTELAVSGAAHWPRKRAEDPYVQARAMQLVHECRLIGELSGAPWFIENPVSAISSVWRKPDHAFHPYEYGGYLPDDDAHPLYPDYYPPRDAYGKKTCLWTGGGFVMPPKRPVSLAADGCVGQGQSKAHNKLGGKSAHTKRVRSATPRGFAEAVFCANAPCRRVQVA
jgi:hypothetical protein